jgi:hypothetical protein
MSPTARLGGPGEGRWAWKARACGERGPEDSRFGPAESIGRPTLVRVHTSGDQAGDEAGEWVDLAGTAAGIGVSYEATRRRKTEGLGADRRWRVGADGEAAVGQLLTQLTTPTRWQRLRRQTPPWRVLHGIPLTDTHGRVRGDVDHLVIGPPGILTLNTKHHRGARVVLDGDELTVNRRPTEHIPKARREAERVTTALRPALTDTGLAELAARLPIRPMIVLVGARLTRRNFAAGVTVVMSGDLVTTLRQMTAHIPPAEVEAVFAVARRSTTGLGRPPGSTP